MRGKAGFTMLELSIVLVIVGLIAAGVLVGRSMIHAAAVRSVADDMARVQSATIVFKQKYGAIPGDMPNATRIWGLAGGTEQPHDWNNGVSCINFQTAESPATCNGDGDKGIGSTVPPNVWNTDEWFLFWKHLANSGLIPGRYTGISGPDGGGWRDAIPGVNVFQTKLNNTGFSVALYPMNGWGMSAGYYGNTMIFGGRTAGYETGSNAFTPEEAASVDAKLDDGKPDKGMLREQPAWWAPACTKYDANGVVQYDFSVKQIDCAMTMLDFTS